MVTFSWHTDTQNLPIIYRLLLLLLLLLLLYGRTPPITCVHRLLSLSYFFSCFPHNTSSTFFKTFSFSFHIIIFSWFSFSSISSFVLFFNYPISLLPLNVHNSQIFLDDVGVLVAMVAITLLAIVVVTIKVVIFQPTVTSKYPLVFISIRRKKIDQWFPLNL